MISSFYCDNDEWKKTWNRSELLTLVETYIKEGTKVKTLKMRTRFLERFFDSEANVLNCECSIEFLFSKVFFPNLYSGKILNPSCQCQNPNEFIPFLDLSTLKSGKVEIMCTECQQTVVESFGQILLNDVIYVRPNDTSSEIGWNDIPKVLIQNDTAYVLCGIIESVPSIDSQNPNSFRGHLLRCTQWYTYDSLQKQLIPSLKKLKFLPHFYVFATHNFAFMNVLKTDQDKKSDFVLFKNFSLFKGDGVSTYICNSCAPDSLFQALSCLFIDEKEFRDLCELRKLEETSSLFDLFDYFSKNDSFSAHTVRNQLLRDQFKFSVKDKTLEIDCESNIYQVIGMFVQPIFPSINSINECKKCGQELKKKHSSVEIDSKKLNEDGIGHLQSCILDKFITDRKSTCSKCGGPSQISNYVGVLLFFDVQMVKSSKNEIFGISTPISIDEIPKRIKIKGHDYKLKSIIRHSPAKSEKEMGHYTAICNIKENWWHFDDVEDTPKRWNSDKFFPHTLIYFIDT